LELLLEGHEQEFQMLVNDQNEVLDSITSRK